MRYPIYEAELRHQEYLIENSSVSRFWIAMAAALIIPAVLATASYFIAAMLEYREARLMSTAGVRDLESALIGIGQVTLVTMNIAQYIVLTMVSYGLAANAIAREQRHQTWDLLLLTNRRARHLVRGKWAASLQALNGDYGMLTLMRIGLVCMALTIQTVFYPQGALFTRWDVLALCGLMTAMSVLDTMFGTAAALLSVLIHRAGAQSALVFLAMRVAGVGFALWWFINSLRLLVTRGATEDWRYIWFSLGCILSYSIATWGMLKLSEIVAIRRGQASI